MASSLLILVGVLGAISAPPAVPPGGPVGYRADGCRLLPAGTDRALTCKGHVKLWRKDLSLECETLHATFDAAGTLKTATCQGAVEIVSAQAVARADRARFDGATGKVELTGRPRAQQAGSMLKATVIRLDVQTGQISTEGQVTGVIAPEAVPAAPGPGGAP